MSAQEKLERDLIAQITKLSEVVNASSQRVLDLNTKFMQDHLKAFEEGGKYAPATIQQAQQQLQQVEAAVVGIRWAAVSMCTYNADHELQLEMYPICACMSSIACKAFPQWHMMPVFKSATFVVVTIQSVVSDLIFGFQFMRLKFPILEIAVVPYQRWQVAPLSTTCVAVVPMSIING